MSNPEELNRAVASNLQLLRKERGYTLDQLASLSKVSKGMLVNVEHGKTNPSIATLARIASALRVSVPRLMEVGKEPDVIISSLKDATPLLKQEGGSTATALLSFEGSSVVELWEWEISPNDSIEGRSHVTGSVEMLMVHKGVLTLHLGDSSFDVEAGSAVRFNADIAHTYTNRRKSQVRLTMVTIEPSK